MTELIETGQERPQDRMTGRAPVASVGQIPSRLVAPFALAIIIRLADRCPNSENIDPSELTRQAPRLVTFW
jgi:hypothetical protein